MTASFRTIIGLLALSFAALCAHAAPNGNSHRAIMIAGGAKAILRDDGRVVVFRQPTFRQKPVLLENAENVTVIAGTTSGLAIRTDGAVLSWSGKCTREEQPICTYPKATIVQKLSRAIAIASNGETHLVVLADGSVWGWGNDWRGLISGLAPVGYKTRLITIPQKLPFPVPMTSITVGDLQGMAIDREGHVWTWASLSSPTLRGLGEEVVGTGGFRAVKVANIPFAKQVAAGIYSVVLTREGDVWVWGESNINQVKRGSATPKAISGFSNSSSIDAGGLAVFSISSVGGLRMIGAPSPDAFPSTVSEFYETPVEVPGFQGLRQVSADLLGIGAINTNGSVTYERFNLQLGD